MSKLASAAVLSVAAAATLALGLASPASAASIGITDPPDTSHGSDLRSVEVKNGDRRIVVTTTHTNLRRDPRTGSGGAIYIDTDRRDRGPEFVFVGGFFSGTDYALLHTEGFGSRKWGKPVDGSYEMKVDYADEQVRMRMSRAALDRPGRVRVAVRVAGTRTDGSGGELVDWLGTPHSFTPWVARG
jgi:opacity protein-like surface antigen